jgi:RimJ/RimL family protein N-acetyltransferase
MMKEIFYGKLVRLATAEPAERAVTFVGWDRDSEFRRLLDDVPPRLWSREKHETWAKEQAEKPKPGLFEFQLRTLQDDRLVGFVELFLETRSHRDAWVGIGIGSRDDWSRGYGTDALELIERYAFEELNLRRLSLGVFNYNPRAFRSYEKAGFVVEGRERCAIQRDGERADVIIMGILLEEWLARVSAAPEGEIMPGNEKAG